MTSIPTELILWQLIVPTHDDFTQRKLQVIVVSEDFPLQSEDGQDVDFLNAEINDMPTLIIHGDEIPKLLGQLERKTIQDKELEDTLIRALRLHQIWDE